MNEERLLVQIFMTQKQLWFHELFFIIQHDGCFDVVCGMQKKIISNGIFYYKLMLCIEEYFIKIFEVHK